MLLSNIVKLVNKRLAGEQLIYSEMESHLDDAVDAVNSRLNACFPVFSEFPNTTVGYPNYSYIPDRYIRSVIVPYVAQSFYSMDEEGAGGALDYKTELANNLFLMERDYLNQVPLLYQAAATQGVLGMDPDLDQNRGLEVYDGFFE